MDNCKHFSNVSDGQLAIGYCSKFDEPDPYCPDNSVECLGPIPFEHDLLANINYFQTYLTTVNKNVMIDKLKGLNKLNHVTLLTDLNKLIKELES